MKVAVLDTLGKKKDELELNPSIFSCVVREDIMARVVHWQQARQQSGNHSTRTISEISGTTKKPFRQKGTGRARQGSTRAVQHRGGAVAHGPVVRSHAYKLPKKVRQLGLKCALSAKAASGDLLVVDFGQMKKPSTKEMLKALAALKCDQALIVTGESVNEVLFRSLSNIVCVDALPQQGLNVLSVLKRKKLLLTPDAIHHIHARLQ